jgi:hypothetical protein
MQAKKKILYGEASENSTEATSQIRELETMLAHVPNTSHCMNSERNYSSKLPICKGLKLTDTLDNLLREAKTPKNKHIPLQYRPDLACHYGSGKTKLKSVHVCIVQQY